jgi:hypothetical protein
MKKEKAIRLPDCPVCGGERPCGCENDLKEKIVEILKQDFAEYKDKEMMADDILQLLEEEKQQYRQEILKWAKDRTYDKNGRCKAEIGQTTNQDVIVIQNYLMKKLKELINKDYE